MQKQIDGVIDSIYSKTVNTRFGPKEVYHAMINGEDINLGFKCAHVEGEMVSLDVEQTQYGLQVIDPKKGPSTNGAAAVAAPSPTAAPQKAGFPVAKNTKDMSIIRQNSGNHASRMVSALISKGAIKTEEEAMEAFFRMAYEITDFSTGHREIKQAEEQGA